jgi:hypothetical protein
MKIMYCFTLLLFAISLHAQTENPEDRPYVKKDFVIILSSKSYSEAKKIATEAAKKLKIKLDLRGLKQHKISGLTSSSKECEDNGWEYPCYVSRGRYDDGEFVTIDYSNAFDSFTKGYYIVTTASGDATLAKSALLKAKKIYKSAYAKQAEIYIGCMH